MDKAKALEVRPFGSDRSRLPAREVWLCDVLADHELPDHQKDRLYLGWFYQGHQIGRSGVNRIQVGEDAFFHWHLWQPELRKSGFGTNNLWSEPYAENPAPNRTLVKLGFEFVKRYRAVPGTINFEQDVNLYRKRKVSLLVV